MTTSLNTIPVFPRPNDKELSSAISTMITIAEHFGPGIPIMDSVLVRAGLFRGMNPAQSMWAVHELIQLGGIIATLLGDRWPDNIVLNDNLPAGVQLADGGVMHFGPRGSSSWGDMAFVVDHEKFANIRSKPTDDRANTAKLFPEGIPRNPDLVDLAVRLNAARDTGRSNNEVAREFTEGDTQKANSLLSQIRRLKREGRLNL